MTVHDFPSKLSAGSPCRLLVIDDDAEIRESLALMLEEEGYEVATALNGFDALIKIGNAGPPDLILLDLTMPVLDGTQFLSNLRDRGLLPKVPVIVVSAVAFRPAPGATSIVTKPIDFDGLLALVREHCHDGQLARVH